MRSRKPPGVGVTLESNAPKAIITEDLFIEGIFRLQAANGRGTARPAPQDGKDLSARVINIVLGLPYFTEPLDYYRYDHFRGAVVFSVAAIETVLREKYPAGKSFYDMILRARRDGLLEDEDVKELATIRAARNSFVHQLRFEVRREDAEALLDTAIRVLGKLSGRQEACGSRGVCSGQ